MTDWTTELRRTWSLLRAQDGSDGGVHTIVLTPDEPAPLRVYVDASGSHHLLVPAASDDVDLVRGDALNCELTTLVFEGASRRFLDIGCSRPALHEVFDELLASIVGAAVESGDPLGAAAATLTRWRDLLRAWSVSMSHEHEMGLFAELLVLEIVAADLFDPDIWRGPMHEPKDVVAGRWWVEVKAVGPTRSTLWINGVEQLADIEGSDGFLVVVTLSEDAKGRTVEDVANSLRSCCVNEPEFDARLLQARWVPHREATRWTASRIDVVQAVSCPRISLAAEPPPGVTRTRYEIDLEVTRSQALRNGVTTLRQLDGRK